jgi:spore maturation protein CgeB
MKLVIFGLTVSSSWGNGHATLWRGLLRALAGRGCHSVFFEHDVPYYAASRDLWEIPGGELALYSDWPDAKIRAQHHLADADVAMITSYCPHGIEATDLVLDARRPLRVFYDLDTPVTLSRLSRGEPTSYIGPHGLGGFDLVLSYTGGCALEELQTGLGAQRVMALYGHVDPTVHRQVAPTAQYRSDLSYLGTYSDERQAALEALFVEPARQRRDRRFLIGGAQYPAEFPWSSNIFFTRHLPPDEHPAFFSSSRLTLNVTRRTMAEKGWCPSGRLFEAAACGTPVLSDSWPGLDAFFAPGEEILTAADTADAVGALDLTDRELRRIGENARARVLGQHTAEHRATELVASFDEAARGDTDTRMIEA